VDRTELVTRLQGRDNAAWRLFITEYGRVVFAVATRLGLEGSDRDDLFQETCLVALKSIHTLRDPSRLSSWVYTTAFRLGIDVLRRRQPEVPMKDLGRIADSSVDIHLDPRIIREMQRIEEVAQLLDAIGSLDVRCRNLLKYLYLEVPRRPYAEISHLVGMPVGSIGPTRARCLQKAEKALRDLSNDPPPPSTGRSRRRNEVTEEGPRRSRERSTPPPAPRSADRPQSGDPADEDRNQ